MKTTFVAAIHAKQKLRVTFYSKEDGRSLVRTCAPMDYGPRRRAQDKRDCFHFWDYDSDTGRHTLSLPPEQIRNIEVLPTLFEPAEFITWSTSASPWFVRRDWGPYS